MTKKITKTTIKSFIRKNLENMYIRNNSRFDGMYDCVTDCGDGSFRKAEQSTKHNDYTLGVDGAWFVNGSNNYFRPYEANGFVGYEVSNCCGNFILAIRECA